MQSCMRTASGTPSRRNSSYSTRHRNRTTADAEHAGEDAGRDSGDDDCERQPGGIAKRDRHAANDGNLEIGQNDHSIICASFGAISRQPFQPQ